MFDLNLELHSGLKVRGSEINFINKKLLKSKNPCGFVISVLKVAVTNPQGFFLMKMAELETTLDFLFGSANGVFYFYVASIPIRTAVSSLT